MADKQAAAPQLSMEEAFRKRSMARTMKGKLKLKPPRYIDRQFESTLDLLSIMGESFPNTSSLVAFNSPSKLSKKDVEKIRNTYGFPSAIRVCLPNPGDRTCNWHPERICVLKGALEAGFRFPVHAFIIRFLAELQVHPCQLYPNSWRFLIIFLLRCRELEIPWSTTMFRSIFAVKNSSDSKPGWVCFQLRNGLPHIVNSFSFPDSHHFWERDFVVLEWEGGDWGHFFVKKFGFVHDSSHFVCELNPKELSDRDRLLADDGRTHYRTILTEKKLIEAGLSILSFEAAEETDNRPANQPTVTRRMMKKAEAQLEPSRREVPQFLEENSQGGKRYRNAGESVRTPFTPDWGICDQDSILGSTSLAVAWSRLSITPPDVLTATAGDKIDEAERLGAQGLYQVNAYLQSATRQGRAHRDENVKLQSERAKLNEEIQDLNSRATRAEANCQSLQKSLRSLAKKKSSEVDKVIDAYHRSERFFEFIDKHDDELRPFNMSVGWDKAVGAVSHRYPTVVNPEDFPCPSWGVSGGSHVAQASGSGGSRRPSGSGLKKCTQVVNSGLVSSHSTEGRMSKREAAVRKSFPGKQLRRGPISSTDTSEEEYEAVNRGDKQPMEVAGEDEEGSSDDGSQEGDGSGEEDSEEEEKEGEDVVVESAEE